MTDLIIIELDSKEKYEDIIENKNLLIQCELNTIHLKYDILILYNNNEIIKKINRQKSELIKIIDKNNCIMNIVFN